MATFAEIADVDFITYMVQTGRSHEEIALHYQNLYPNHRGLSSRSIRRYCFNHNISRLSDQDLCTIVEENIRLYGHTFGRRLMQGSIRAALGITSGAVSQRRIANALRTVAPLEYEARARDLIVRTNPIPYYAPYFGYKAHLDQNEKITAYGCTHVIMVDGCSRFIVGYAAMPIKNPILIYQQIFLPALLNFGVWDQVRTDHGQEFCLLGFVQNLISRLRNNQERQAFRTTPSTQNYVVERFWPEVNSRINYPVKRAINRIIEENDFDLNDPIFKYCLSRISMYVTFDAMNNFIQSWNFHRVPGPRGCVPIECMRATSRTAHPPGHLIPNTLDAVNLFEENGGVLTRTSEFGTDPLAYNEYLFQEREAIFAVHVPSPHEVFSATVHGDTRVLKHCLVTFYDITLQLSGIMY